MTTHDIRSQSTFKLQGGYLAFPNQTIQPNSIARLVIQPDVSFLPTRLSVAPSCASFFSIIELRIGNNSYQFNNAEASAEHFPPLPYDTRPEDRESIPHNDKGVCATLFPSLPTSKEEREIYEKFTSQKFITCSPAMKIQIVVAYRINSHCDMHSDCRMNAELAAASCPDFARPRRFEGLLWGIVQNDY